MSRESELITFLLVKTVTAVCFFIAFSVLMGFLIFILLCVSLRFVNSTLIVAVSEPIVPLFVFLSLYGGAIISVLLISYFEKILVFSPQCSKGRKIMIMFPVLLIVASIAVYVLNGPYFYNNITANLFIWVFILWLLSIIVFECRDVSHQVLNGML